jgi:predicted dehydrogenase
MIRWGIAGPGGIAATFAEAMARVDGGEVVAVASRSQERADAFGDRFEIPRRYGDYRAMADDADVDAVYVATIQTRHAADAILYLDAGKHVLCEKPLAINADEVVAMTDAAERSNRFLMEALWSRFLPSYRRLVELIGEGRIGEPLHVDADFGFRMPADPAHRLYDLTQGGGALLDLGIYPLQLCTLVLGPVERIAAVGVLGSTGVDEQTSVVLQHQRGGIGVAKCALRAWLSNRAMVSGTDGIIELPATMHAAQSLKLITALGRERETIDCSFEGNGFEFQIEEVHRLLAAGAVESPTMPLADSLALARVMDEVRTQIGLRYPGEA